MATKVDQHESVAVLTLGDDENRFAPDWLDEVTARLDEIEGTSKGLVTAGIGKFYSNGLDLEWLSANAERGQWYVGAVQRLFARILTFPMPTIAAVNGHAFGAGAMLAIAHDYRVMRSDRGYFCFPEADINIPFTPGMAALIQAKLTPQTAVASMTTARRFAGSDAQAAGLVDDTASEQELVQAAVDRIRPLVGKDPGTLGAIKSTMYASVITALQ
ncbi:enoyl-CoA hydratase-related protein [Mycobacterium parmense]|uniref:Putative enoyl-coa hydratase/isomerase family protein n=1 Tax=Mycobacterium parmense TaxID=185642 RepID=A0A7I7YUH3_9MYCO|nr:enoyl-CoA hydratase-related protein [Mycobacterium parmense]MCV7351036.1 enoyl-CoA hydratase/isomerase family protein [Mycobacterium parmense]ORW60609.1 enoyl-CoA hydratase [Mycobacterium parmense]BBZ45526.1 putative enoyl-coa hydratase/isomerase family protein [Mycobacterium parmense]